MVVMTPKRNMPVFVLLSYFNIFNLLVVLLSLILQLNLLTNAKKLLEFLLPMAGKPLNPDLLIYYFYPPYL